LEKHFHEPVLVREVTEALAPRPDGTYLDGTVGGGGHAAALLARAPGARLVGLDRDEDAVRESRRRLETHDGKVIIVQTDYRNAGETLAGLGIRAVDGALLDLGVSSHQLDDPERGFSFQKDGPLDMRMDRRQNLTAATLVNTAPERELVSLFRKLGEERRAAVVARAIVRRRERKSFARTLDLADTVSRALGVGGRSGIHPATRVFQALRIAVNDELGALRQGLAVFTSLLMPGGRLAVISFHSLEDRIVKQFFREESRAEVDAPGRRRPAPNPARRLRILTRKPVGPSPSEQAANPRSRSARLRVAEKLPLFPSSP